MSATDPPTDNRSARPSAAAARAYAWLGRQCDACADEQRRPWGTLGLFGAVFVLLGLAVWGVAAGPIVPWLLAAVLLLLAAAPLYCLISNARLANRAIILLILIMFLALGLMAGLWLVVHVHWLGQDAERMHYYQTLRFNGAQYRAELDYGPTAPEADGGGRPVVLTLVPVRDAAEVQPVVMVVAAVASGMRLVDEQGASVASILLKPAVAAPAIWRGRLVNDGAMNGTRRGGVLGLRFFGLGGPAAGEPLYAPLIVEGDWGFRVRRFVTSTVDQNGPLIFLGLLLAPAAAALARRWTEERRTQTEQWRQQEFRRARDAFRENFQAEDLRGACAELAALERIPDRNQEMKAEIDLAKALLKFATGGQDASTQPPPEVTAATGETDSATKTELIMMSNRWPEGFAAAFLMAHSNWQNTADESFPKRYAEARLLLQYPETARRLDLQDRLALAFAEDSTSPFLRVQGRQWPPPPTCGARPPLDPLAGDDAADDREWCFLIDGGFDGKHPLFSRTLWRKSGSHFVFGPPGCGRTAFAAMLATSGNERHLTIRLDGRSATDYRLGPLRQLAEFVLSHPTFLDRLGSARRQLLALLMAESLGGPGPAAAAIERAQAKLPTLPDLEGAERAEQRQYAGRLLQLLLRALPAAAPPATIPTAVDSDIQECMHAFGFERVVYVVDLPPNPAVARALSRAVFDRFEAWEGSGADFIVFAPDRVAHAFSVLPRRVARHELTWSRVDIERLILVRFRAFDKTASPAERFDSADGLTRLIDHSKLDDKLYNPRRFFRLWREAGAAARADREEKIKEAHIARAGAAMEGTSA